MATVRALAATGEQIEDSELVVTSALAVNVKAYLPAIDDGATTTVDNGYMVRVMANAAGDVEIVDVFGKRVAIVPAFTQALFTAGGDVDTPVWTVSPVGATWSVGEAVTAAGSSTPALGTTGPAASGTVIWYSFQKLDGTLGYIATWS